MSTTEPTIPPLPGPLGAIFYGLPSGCYDSITAKADSFTDRQLADLRSAIEKTLLDPDYTVISNVPVAQHIADIEDERVWAKCQTDFEKVARDADYYWFVVPRAEEDGDTP